MDSNIFKKKLLLLTTTIKRHYALMYYRCGDSTKYCISIVAPAAVFSMSGVFTDGNLLEHVFL